MIYVPKGFAHGFQTLADNAEIVYQTSEFYAPDAARGYRYDDVHSISRGRSQSQ